MKHTVLFQNRENHWDNALPLGNGVFGCMLFYEKGRLHMLMNHYEVYYNRSPYVLPKDQLAFIKTQPYDGKARHQGQLTLAEANIPGPGEPYCDYVCRKERNDSMTAEETGLYGFSNSYPCTGDLNFSFRDDLAGADHSLLLSVEDAKAVLTLGELTMETVVAREDCIINKVTQPRALMLQSIEISFPEYRDYVYPQITYAQKAPDTFVYTVARRFKEDPSQPFTFCGVIRLVGAEGVLENNIIRLTRADREMHILTGIFTQWNYADPEAEGLAVMAGYRVEDLRCRHRDYWTEFFDRSSISIPDKFLEHIYYVNQYALDCCSGRDGVMKHHACGLNGLWAIRHPNLWGSMWYWDVNIQAAFAGVFSSNRLELGKVFSDGLLSYRELMAASAKMQHDMTGYAADYPYYMYYCVVPWCAQYLWYQYEYSLDEDYLRQEAYPFFRKVCEFITQIFLYDPETDTYTVYPDISPEQGPLAHNTTITVACTKYLLRFTLKAAEILGQQDGLLDQCRAILEKLPPYALTADGSRLKDSPDAPDNMFIRHPSMLMPLFPIGEFDLADMGADMERILNNTLDFLEDNCEIGIFGGSWLAAAAARLGRGQTALRLLYERGIDHMLRSNGLTAEETERFMNYCLILRQPLYYPCMMEFTGEMLAAVNEMLLQSQNGLIRVFPALPDGNPEYDRLLRRGHSCSHYPDLHIAYEAWKDVRFDKLLAKGAFEISAQATEGRLSWILVHSKKGGAVSVTSPLMRHDLQVFRGGQAVTFRAEGGILTFDTLPGESYLIAADPNVDIAPADGSCEPKVLSRETYTRRHIYIGEDPETGYQKSLDGFIRDWYLGNVRHENHTVYKFDLGTDAHKEYQKIFHRQSFAAETRPILGMAPIFVEDLQFTPRQGYGFEDASGITTADRGAPDGLRRDFAQGTDPAEFLIEVPRGQYELLAVSGDAEEDSVTCLDCLHGRSTGGEVVKAGQYQCKLLPLVLEEDGLIRLKISSKPGYRWKLNYLFLNVVKGY